MNKHLKSAITFLIAVFALFAIVVLLTNAQEALTSINPYFMALAALFFLISVFFWVFSWSYLLKKHTTATYPELLTIGAGSVYGALTPIQLGADALRSLRMKELYGMRYSDSIAASMVAKGTKFLLLALLAAVVSILFFQQTSQNLTFLLAFLSGLFVIALAIFFFLSPLNPKIGKKIASFFNQISKPIPFAAKLANFFTNYTTYIASISKKSFATVLILVTFSWIFEILALQYSFLSIGINLELIPLLVFMVLVSVLERAPFLPRGIGLVEFVGYNFLAFPELLGGAKLTPSQIGGILIAYDIVRLIIPPIVSMIISATLLRNLRIKKSRTKPEQQSN